MFIQQRMRVPIPASSNYFTAGVPVVLTTAGITCRVKASGKPFACNLIPGPVSCARRLAETYRSRCKRGSANIIWRSGFGGRRIFLPLQIFRSSCLSSAHLLFANMIHRYRTLPMKAAVLD